MPTHTRSTKPFVGIAGGVALIAATAVAALFVHPKNDPSQYAMTCLIGALGVATGWLIGLLASPYGRVEEKRFSQYAATVSAFLSGYVLSKVEPTLAVVLADGKLVTQRLYGVRVIVFLICLIAAAITMYVFRLYVDENEAARKAMDAVQLP
jgi:MFS family permease